MSRTDNPDKTRERRSALRCYLFKRDLYKRVECIKQRKKTQQISAISLNLWQISLQKLWGLHLIAGFIGWAEGRFVWGGADSHTFELQLRIHLFTVRGSFSPLFAQSVQPFGALSTCSRQGQGQEEGVEADSRAQQKPQDSQDNHYNNRAWSRQQRGLFASFAFDPFDIVTLDTTLTQWLADSLTHSLIRLPTLQLNCECTRAQLPRSLARPPLEFQLSRRFLMSSICVLLIKNCLRGEHRIIIASHRIDVCLRFPRCLFMLNIKSLQAIAQWSLARRNFITVCVCARWAWSTTGGVGRRGTKLWSKTFRTTFMVLL